MVAERETSAWQWTRTAPGPLVCLLGAQYVGLGWKVVS